MQTLGSANPSGAHGAQRSRRRRRRRRRRPTARAAAARRGGARGGASGRQDVKYVRQNRNTFGAWLFANGVRIVKFVNRSSTKDWRRYLGAAEGVRGVVEARGLAEHEQQAQMI